MIFRFFNFDMSRGQGVNNNNNNNNGHFPEGAGNQEIQQWRQSAPGQGVQETQTWMLWEKCFFIFMKFQNHRETRFFWVFHDLCDVCVFLKKTIVV